MKTDLSFYPAVRRVSPAIEAETDVTELLATGEQTRGALGLFRQTIAPNSGPPIHIHRVTNEFFYVVRGGFRVKLGDRIVRVSAGSFVFVPRGTAHAFRKLGRSPGFYWSA